MIMFSKLLIQRKCGNVQNIMNLTFDSFYSLGGFLKTQTSWNTVTPPPLQINLSYTLDFEYIYILYILFFS